MAAGARLAAPRRVHAAGRDERQARAGAGRGRRRSDRGVYAGPGPAGIRSAARHAERDGWPPSMRTSSICIAKLEASLDFPDEGYHFLAGDEAATILTRLLERDRHAACRRRARPIGARRRHGGDRRPSQRRQVQPLQRARGRRSRNRDRRARHDARSADRARRDQRAVRDARGHGRHARFASSRWSRRACARSARARETADLVVVVLDASARADERGRDAAARHRRGSSRRGVEQVATCSSARRRRRTWPAAVVSATEGTGLDGRARRHRARADGHRYPTATRRRWRTCGTSRQLEAVRAALLRARAVDCSSARPRSSCFATCTRRVRASTNSLAPARAPTCWRGSLIGSA